MIYWAYVIPLLVICACSLTGREQMIRTAMAILANWIINSGFVLATGIYDPWWFFLATDALTAWVILYHPAGKAQALIGYTYIAQILMHCVYAVSNSVLAEYAYWQILTAIAFVQLLLLGGWIGGFWWRRYSDHSRNSFGPVATRKKGVAG